MAQEKTCKQCRTQFIVTDEDLEFIKKVSPEISGKVFQFPLPALCYHCRERKRLLWRNDRYIYKRKNDKDGKEVISIYSPDKKDVKVWANSDWRKDNWDPIDFGRDYDLSRGFFEQFGELLHKVPRQATNSTMVENCEFCNHVWKSKNCYLCFNVGPAENCSYCSEAWYVKDCVDCLYIKNCEYCYSAYDSNDCHNCSYIEHCKNCSESYFAFDCIGCNNVFLSSGLRNKSYYIENRPYPKEEYFKKVEDYDASISLGVEKCRRKFNELKLKTIRKENNNVMTENCTGDYLIQCKDCKECYCCHTSINCQRVTDVDGDARDCRDSDFITDVEACYESTSVAGFKNHFCVWIAYGHDNLYCNFCENSSNCFGCVGLNHKEYCILNKQYSKEQYEKLVEKIIEKMKADGEWGEFFPMELSYFCFNESVANLFFPSSKEEAEKLGANWQDNMFEPHFEGESYQPKDSIEDYVSNDDEREKLLAGVLKCETTGRPYKIIPQELAYYLEHKIPVPRVHSDVRYKELFRLRNPRKLYHRQCMCGETGHGHSGKCPVEFETTYAPDRPEKVFCEKCYQESVA